MIEVPASAPRVCKVFCEKENMAAAFAALAVASSPHPPRFDGMFLSLNSQTALWDTSMWKRDLEAMKTAQLRFGEQTKKGGGERNGKVAGAARFAGFLGST